VGPAKQPIHSPNGQSARWLGRSGDQTDFSHNLQVLDRRAPSRGTTTNVQHVGTLPSRNGAVAGNRVSQPIFERSPPSLRTTAPVALGLVLHFPNSEAGIEFDSPALAPGSARLYTHHADGS